ncbi:MAG: hypothetical protein ACC650_01180 [Gammaproteobacteria bacterium]
MQYRIFHNKFIRKVVLCWASGLLAVVATTALADGDASHGMPQYLAQNTTDQYRPDQYRPGQYRTDQSSPSPVNPWSLPQQQPGPPESQPRLKYYGQPAPVNPAGGRYQEGQGQMGRGQTGRFVTPEILESLKQQQKQYQVMPENQRYRQPAERQYMPTMPVPGIPGAGLPGSGLSGPGLPGQWGYGYPLYGTGSTGPLYDVPAVSPWGNDADILYRGESFPLVPSEAIGGIPPMPMSSFGLSNEKNSNAGDSIETDENNVFNPFNFLPNSSLGGP